MQFLADEWAVCPVFGWFVGGVASLWIVWLVRVWMQVLQLKKVNSFSNFPSFLIVITTSLQILMSCIFYFV